MARLQIASPRATLTDNKDQRSGVVMATNNKRKWRWSSKGIFGLKASNKRILQDKSSQEDADNSTTPSAVVDISVDSGTSRSMPAGSKSPTQRHLQVCRLPSAAEVHRSGGEYDFAHLSCIKI